MRYGLPPWRLSYHCMAGGGLQAGSIYNVMEHRWNSFLLIIDILVKRRYLLENLFYGWFVNLSNVSN